MDYEAFFQISYGLYLVTSKKGNDINGFIGNTVFQVTAIPPTVAISVNRNNLTHEYIESSEVFAISVLGQNVDKELIQTFGYKSGREINKFENRHWDKSTLGLPLIKNASTAVFECAVINKISVGTHTIFVGKILSAEKINNDSSPLTYDYYRAVFKGASPKNAPTYIDTSKLNKSGGSMEDKKYTCQICNYVYDPEKGDPEHGIAPGTAFEDIPDDWVCPVCKAGKDKFKAN